jgi:GT2 family glycosyltransferase
LISAVIPTFRGRKRLERNLPGVLAAQRESGDAWEVIVVDDGGGGLGALPDGVRLVVLPENRGYGPAVNAGVAAAQGDLLLILNDDVALETGSVGTLRRHFPDPTLFAVVPAILSPLATCGDEGGKTARREAGLIEIGEATSAATHPALYPVGCCFLCPRALFLELGGYDDLYAPFFWEDVDLGYRAWRRGLRTLHAPEAVCRHEGSATLREQRSRDEHEAYFFRNRVLFHLRNLGDPAWRAQAFGALAAFALFDARLPRTRGLAEALDRYPGFGSRNDPGLSDAEILRAVAG